MILFVDGKLVVGEYGFGVRKVNSEIA